MLIWRGTGILAPIIIVGFWLITSFVGWTIGYDDLKSDYLPIFIFQVIGLILGGVVNFIFGKANNDAEVKDNQGNQFKEKHDLFFIPMQYWSFIIVPIIFFFAFSQFNKARTQKLGKEKEYKEIRSIVDPANIDLIQNPKVGDKYYFIGHLRKENRNRTVTAYGKVIEIQSSKVKIYFPDSKPFMISEDRKYLNRENIDTAFPNHEEHIGVMEWIDKSFLMRIYKSPTKSFKDYSMAAPLLNAEKGAILHSIYRGPKSELSKYFNQRKN